MMVPLLQHRFGGRGPWSAFLRVRDAVDEQLYAEIARRRAADVPGDDILSMLLATDASDAELRDDLLTLLVAGHETTATTMAWTLERLMRHPEALARSREDPAYLDAAVKESQRVRPVLTYVMRTLTEPMDVGGYRVRAGATLGTSITLLHRRPDLYPDPTAFKPERFLGRKPGTYEWIPFGGGVRRCLGASFALTEMKVVLETILASTSLRPVGGGGESTTRRAITFAPSRGGRIAIA
jgi:cytochrome P450